MNFSRKKEFLVTILLIGLFFCSFLFVTCGKESSTDELVDTETPIHTDTQTSNENSSPMNEREKNTDRPNLQNHEPTNEEQTTQLLSPFNGAELLRKPLHNYPSTMGPPNYNSVWNDHEIFVGTGDAGFTKIALSEQNMIEEKSYLYNRVFLQASEEYFLCRDKTYVYCLSKEDSKELWKHQVFSQGHDYYFAVNSDIVTHMHFDNTIQKATVKGFQSETGNLLWTFTLEDKTHSFLGFSPSILLFTKGSSLVGIHPTTGKEVWHHDAILKPADEPYQQEYYRNFRILSDATVFIPIEANGEPFAYRVEPKTGKILTEYRINSPQEVHFQDSYVETPSSILCSYRKGSQFFFISYNKDNGDIQWVTPFHQILGDFSLQYGVECEYTLLQNFQHQILVEISYSTIISLDVESGEILWSHQSEFSQIKNVWKDTFLIRLIEFNDQQFRIEFLNIVTGLLEASWNLPSSFHIPNAPISLIYSTDTYIVVRMNIDESTPCWLFFEPSTPGIQYYGYLPDSQKNLHSSLVFFVTSNQNQMLFLVSGDNGYELEIVTIPALASVLNGDSRQAYSESPLV